MSVVVLVGAAAVGVLIGVLAAVWVIRSARRLEGELLQEYGIGPDPKRRATEPGA